jgi:hypothetical protein
MCAMGVQRDPMPARNGTNSILAGLPKSGHPTAIHFLIDRLING